MAKSYRARTTSVATKAAHAKKAQRKAGRSPPIAGSRVGTKKRDMRWRAPDGRVWASRFEYEVYEATKDQCWPTSENDTLAYDSDVRNGVCTACGSSKVVQAHRYTPDLFCRSKTPGKFFFIEAKGYIRRERRTLLRAFRRARQEIDLRLVIQKDYKVSSTMTLLEWVDRYLKIPVHVWNGNIPEEWK